MKEDNQYFSSPEFKEKCRIESELEFNVLIGDVSEELKDSFFGPIFSFDEFHHVETTTSYPQLMKKFGFFKSTGEARRNGWDKGIPEGWSSHTIGKLKRKLFILKRTEEW